MHKFWSVGSLVVFAPLLTNCSHGGGVVLQPQTNDLLVSPQSIVLSASAPTSVPFGVADKAAAAGTVTVSQGSCGGIATLGSSASGHAAHVMTVGSNPGVQPGGGVSGGSGSAFSVSPLAPGSCTLRLTDTAGNIATIYVNVTK